MTVKMLVANGARRSGGVSTPILGESADTAVALAARVGALEAVSALLPGVFTVDTLPSAQANLGKYADVTDLFGSTRDKVLAASSVIGGVTKYYWKPVRPVFAASMVAATMALVPLKMPSILRLTGTLTASRTLTLSTVNAFPGAMFEIAFDGALGLNTLTIAGLDLGATLSLVLGGRRRTYFDGTAWQTF